MFCARIALSIKTPEPQPHANHIINKPPKRLIILAFQPYTSTIKTGYPDGYPVLIFYEQDLNRRARCGELGALPPRLDWETVRWTVSSSVGSLCRSSSIIVVDGKYLLIRYEHLDQRDGFSNPSLTYAKIPQNRLNSGFGGFYNFTWEHLRLPQIRWIAT